MLVAGCASLAGLNDPSEQADQEVKAPPPSPTDPPSNSQPACTPRVEGPFTDGLFHATAWEGPEPVLDGAFEDWACLPRHELGPGVWTTPKFPKTTNAQVAFGWTRDALFFYNVDENGAPDPLTEHAGVPPTRGEKWLLSQFIRDRAQLPG